MVGLLWVFVWIKVFRDSQRQHTSVNAAELAYIEAGKILEEQETHLQKTQ